MMELLGRLPSNTLDFTNASVALGPTSWRVQGMNSVQHTSQKHKH